MTIKPRHLFVVDEQLTNIENEILDQINLTEEVELHFPSWHIVELQRLERKAKDEEVGL